MRLLLLAALLAACQSAPKPQPATGAALPPVAPPAPEETVPQVAPRPPLGIGLGGQDCPDESREAALQKLLKGPRPAKSSTGAHAAVIALCRYVNGDKDGARAALKKLGKSKDGDALLEATLFLAESTAMESVATLELDRGRRKALGDARVLDSVGAKAEAEDTRLAAERGKLLTPEQVALQRGRVQVAHQFAVFLKNARPDFKPAQRSVKFLAEEVTRASP